MRKIVIQVGHAATQVRIATRRIGARTLHINAIIVHVGVRIVDAARLLPRVSARHGRRNLFLLVDDLSVVLHALLLVVLLLELLLLLLIDVHIDQTQVGHGTTVLISQVGAVVRGGRVGRTLHMTVTLRRHNILLNDKY